MRLRTHGFFFELFRFCPYDQLLTMANTNRQLHGEVSAIRSTINDCTQGTHCVMLTIR
ncbi:hypothetical protein BRARA_C01010 [Brassica rapa]|uniref:Uncharacterized protein n=1 Tax=Brassica campestris TaxID=3711 RepID=A0A397ZTF5_BRACM|nr:hypothetical protein BRARA_C01010 [Brassica rapa]